jgi:hypothetical protein
MSQYPGWDYLLNKLAEMNPYKPDDGMQTPEWLKKDPPPPDLDSFGMPKDKPAPKPPDSGSVKLPNAIKYPVPPKITVPSAK